MKPFKLVVLVPLFAAAGCAPGAYCESEFSYLEAISVPVVQPTDGLKPRDSVSALKIPPAPANAVPYAESYIDEDGDDAVRCLDQPHEMAPLVLSPEPAKPVEPVKPAEPKAK